MCGGTFKGPVGTSWEKSIRIIGFEAALAEPAIPLEVVQKAPDGGSAESTAATVPVMFRIASRPHAPALSLTPSAQARKGAALFDNHIVFNPFRLSLRPFRNWALGTGGAAGAWGRDEIRNIIGSVNYSIMTFGSSGTGSFTVTDIGSYTTASGGANTRYSSINFNPARVVPTGPQNVPPHIWQPIILYLGRPA